MYRFGYVKVSAASPKIRLADPIGNAAVISDAAKTIESKGCGIILFPELCITGASCQDLFFDPDLCSKAREALDIILKETAELNSVLVVGLPMVCDSRLFNCAAVIQQGEILGIVPKKEPAAAGQERWFSPGEYLREDSFDVPSGDLIFTDGKASFAVEVGSDIYLNPSPAADLCTDGALIMLNPAAELCLAGSKEKTKKFLSVRSEQWACAYVQASAGPSECTTDAVYSGACSIYEAGEMLKASPLLSCGFVSCEVDTEYLGGLRRRRKTDIPGPSFDRVFFDELKAEGSLTRKYSVSPFLPSKGTAAYCREIFEIQAMGLAMRLGRAYSQAAVIGTSGGSDSTLALAVSARAAQILGKDPSFVLAVTMPGFGTSKRTKDNAFGLMDALGCTVKEISIAEAAEKHLNDIGHDMSVHNVAYENAQARERTQVLMDLANDINGMVVGTGDMSETALGWCTYGGDQLSMYGVNSGLTKGMVKAVIKTLADDCRAKQGPFGKNEYADLLADCLYDILDTPISPELLPTDENGEIAQITEDKVGPYELHDFFLWHLLKRRDSKEKTAWLAKQSFSGIYAPETVDKWLDTFCRRFATQQFKRDCSAGAPQVIDMSLSPRGGLEMPSDASFEFRK